MQQVSVAAPPHTTRNVAAPVATAAALTAFAAYTYVRSPFQAGAFPTCVFHAGTGLYCPGCGGLRAVNSLLHGHLVEALSLNPLAILAVIPVTIVAIVWWFGAKAGWGWKAPRVSATAMWAAGAVVLVFTVLRNIPFFAPYLAP